MTHFDSIGKFGMHSGMTFKEITSLHEDIIFSHANFTDFFKTNNVQQKQNLFKKYEIEYMFVHSFFLITLTLSCNLK